MRHLYIVAIYLIAAEVCGAKKLPTDSVAVSDTIANAILLKDVVKVANSNSKIKSSAIGLTHLSQSAITATPTVFGEADVIKTLQLQPGVSAGIEGFAGMMVRGGSDDQNLFLIDGNPVYQMNHLGGLFSAYNVSVIDGLSFYKATFPARYGGRLSSVIDISTKNGDWYEHHGSVSIGLMSGNLFFSGPIYKGHTSYAVGLRRSWMELVTVPAMAILNASKKKDGEKVAAGYNFTDFNLKINHRLSNGGMFSLLAYYGYDHLKMGETYFSNDKDADAEDYLDKDEKRLGWGNMLASVQYAQPLSDMFSVDMNVAYTRYKSRYRQISEKQSGENGGNDYRYVYSHRTEQNIISDVSAKCALMFNPNQNVTMRLGINYVHHHFLPQQVVDANSSLTETVVADYGFDANEYSCYVDGDFGIFPWLNLNVGLRASIFCVPRKCYVTAEPRVSLNFKVMPSMSAKVGYARMSQFVQQVSDNYISLPTDYWVPITDRFSPLISHQISAGLYYSIHGGLCEISLEGYYKKMNNMLEYCDGYNIMPASTPWSDKLVAGSGRAYGIDLLIEKSKGKLYGAVGYGLLWSDRLFADLNFGRRFPSKYDNRHKLNLMACWKLSKRVDINASWTYMTGNRATISLENYSYAGSSGLPTTIVPTYPQKDEEMLDYYEGKNNVRIPAYHRLDLGINIKMPKKDGKEGIWNVSIYNAYSRMNPIMIEKNNDRQTFGGKHLKPRFRSLSLFPIIPSVSYIYKF